MSNCQVIITLGGTGKRFSDAGYGLPKYLLKVGNTDVISLVTKMYYGYADIVYLCNKYHIDKYSLNNKLGKFGKVVGVNPGKGPGDAILQSINSIDLAKPTFVQYCDTFQPWNFADTFNEVKTLDCDSAVIVTDENCPSVYDGTLYGRVKVNGSDVIDIKEKAEPSYSDFIGCGTFYFKTGEVLKQFIEIQDEHKDKYYLNGESYINCTIKAMLDNGLKVSAINIHNYLNLGVPRDYEDYLYWEQLVARKNDRPSVLKNSTVVMPAAGLGSRFKDHFDKPKPLIDVDSAPMFMNAIRHSFGHDNSVIVTRKDLDFYTEFNNAAENSGSTVIGLDSITDGQAITVMRGLSAVDDRSSIVINSCDQGILFDEDKFNKLRESSDIIICGMRNYQPAISKPNSFSWVESNGDAVTKVSSKKCNGDPRKDLVFISCLFYKNKEILTNSINSLIKRNCRVNNELYIDESINDSISFGYKVSVLTVDSYLNWGTPEELNLFNWWSNFFKVANKNDYLA